MLRGFKYPKGYFVSKRGETPPADRDKTLVVDLSELGKHLISWHSQRPNVAYSETKIFDKYFEQLFKREYRDHRLEWMIKSGGLDVVLKGIEKDNIRFTPDFS